MRWKGREPKINPSTTGILPGRNFRGHVSNAAMPLILYHAITDLPPRSALRVASEGNNNAIVIGALAVVGVGVAVALSGNAGGSSSQPSPAAAAPETPTSPSAAPDSSSTPSV